MLSTSFLSLSLLAVSSLSALTVSASDAHLHRISARGNKHSHRAIAGRKAAAAAAAHEELMQRSENGTEHVNHLGKRAFNGVGTYYYTDVGLGACGEFGLISHLVWGST
jgi:hypothetical protein